jgi:hypothetical protein
MRGNCDIGAAAGEAKCVRLVCFEDAVCLLEFTVCGRVTEVGYITEQPDLK